MAIVKNLNRVMGDTYPIKIQNLKIDGATVDLSNSIGDLKYNKNGQIITIIGSQGDVDGNMQFEPSALDFDTLGKFKYDITIDDGEYITTYFSGVISVEESI